MSQRFDVVIIGSGISSLTCAALLAKRGKSVLVLEQHRKVGGYLHCFHRFGQQYDTGAHYVGAMDSGQSFHTLLRYLDVYDESIFVPLDEQGFDVFQFPGLRFELPKGYAQAIARLVDIFPSERLAIEKYFDRVRQVVRFFPTYEFSDFDESQMPSEALDQSLAGVVSSLTQNTKLQTLLYAHCALHAVAPEDVPFGFHAIVTDSLIRGPYGFRKGGDALAQSFCRRIEERGGQVLTRARVSKLHVVDRQISRVECDDGRVFEADWVISGIHPKATFRLLTDDSSLTPIFRKRLDTLEESVGLFGIYGVFAQKPASFDPLRNYYYFSSFDPKVYRRDSASTENPNAVFVAAAQRGDSGESGACPVNIYTTGPIEWFDDWKGSSFTKRPDPYKNFKDSYARRVVNLVDRYEPGFSDSLSRFTSSSPLTNLHYNGSEEGSAFGLYHSIQNTGPRAIGPRTKILNLLLTGQNSLFPGLLGAAISALRTTGHLVGIKAMITDLRRMAEASQ